VSSSWLRILKSDPIPWLLERENPAVRHLTLRMLCDRPGHDPEVSDARRAAMAAVPISAILAAQQPAGHWEKPGPGYATKYRGTVWQIIFLDQLGADGADPRVRSGCEYVLEHALASESGFGASGAFRLAAPPPSAVLHCLNGNLLRALVGFGWLFDSRVQQAVDWEARAITGEKPIRYYRSGTSGPGFACAANGGLPCAWGAVKAMRGLARIPPALRSQRVQQAIAAGAEFLLGHDIAAADYPTADGRPPSTSWFKLGFPSGYVTDVLQNLEVLCELGSAHDPRLRPAIGWLLERQNRHGQWANNYAYRGKTWIDFEPQGAPSKWVTLRACQVLRAVFE
jgi:hypothetical protein